METQGFAVPAPAWAEPGQPPTGGGWPANELEQVLSAAIGDPGATPRVIEVLARSHVWIPLPVGADPSGQALDLPTIELAGARYVPVFSSEEQFVRHAPGMSCAVAPAWEFARGLPLGLGIAVNPDAPVGIPVPPEGVGELRRGPREQRWDAVAGSPDAPVGDGARVALREPEPHEEPVAFLTAVCAELAALPGVLTARRALASVEGEPTVLFVGVQLDPSHPADPAGANAALGRALGVAPLPGGVHIVLLDLAADPVVDWMLTQVRPFYQRG
ncbi:enhanced serine sensitivity protein SseB [Kitasatospora acidiphila]|uniref:Enhanced serine sensitivity protein SseB n=1 Tax=Kitasatospora acidiphila TaxID=2567942 RepID=A0A540W353_9ACTN|nr:enhanced serine sensitivity protein SseB [Kitasatospora acidiphila]